MNLPFFNLNALEQELKELPHLHRVAFAAAICERMLPNYNAFSRMENWGNPSVPRKALDYIWQSLQGKPADEAQLRQLAEDCASEDICPYSEDTDEFCSSYYLFEAQESLAAIYASLQAYLNPTSLQFIIQVVKCARFNTIELFICARDKSFNASQYKDKKDKLEAIANHALAVRELAKENEDLQRLKEAKTLDCELLKWLRTSFNNDGKSIIDAI